MWHPCDNKKTIRCKKCPPFFLTRNFFLMEGASIYETPHVIGCVSLLLSCILVAILISTWGCHTTTSRTDFQPVSIVVLEENRKDTRTLMLEFHRCCWWNTTQELWKLQPYQSVQLMWYGFISEFVGVNHRFCVFALFCAHVEIRSSHSSFIGIPMDVLGVFCDFRR